MKNGGKIIVIFSPFIMLLVYKICSVLGIKTICVFKILTGHNCYGCGITKAIVLFLKLDFAGAFYTNPLVIIVLPLLLFIWAKCVFGYIMQRKQHKFSANGRNGYSAKKPI